MKLKEARLFAIKYCEENNCKYTYISHNNVAEFYLANEEDKHTVFFCNRNGSLKPYRNTQYAVDFHKELKRRRKHRDNDNKRKVANVLNYDSEIEE